MRSTGRCTAFMPRLPYKPDDDAGPDEIVAPIRARRGGTLLHLDRQLLYSPPFALGWNHLMGAVRTGLSLPGRLREIAICVVATVNRAPYEFHHHAPVLLAAGGTPAQVEALGDVDSAQARSDLFDARERAAIRLAIEMTRAVDVSDATFDAARTALGDDRQLVELVGTIASYNMVSRVIVALGIEPE
jgi:alkylhydroperoxidase family enzyme